MIHFVKKSYPTINKLSQDFMRFKMFKPAVIINTVEIKSSTTGNGFTLTYEWED